MYKMNRLTIFSFYNSKGYAANYVFYLLRELREVSDRIIVAVNGIIDEQSYMRMQEITGEIIIRENKGFDAGAYKEVLFEYLKCDLSGYDELILCNDTFWGFLRPFKGIIDTMALRKCDLWGICYVENEYANHIPSFFLAFRKSAIIKSFWDAFSEIDSSSTEIGATYGAFECGIFNRLVEMEKMSYDYYAEIDGLNFYSSAGKLISKYGFPILKRRIVSNRWHNKSCLVNYIKYIKYNTSYDYRLILEDLHSNYDMLISEEKVENAICDFTSENNHVFHSHCSKVDILAYIEEKCPIYIYGAGAIAGRIYWLYLRENEYFKGFIVSDEIKLTSDKYLKQPVYHFSDLDLKDCKIIVAVDRQKYPDVLNRLGEYNILAI